MKNIIKVRPLLFAVAMLLIAGNCYGGIISMTGTVVDAETGEPIEGAVVLVEWSAQTGIPGFTYWDRYKVIETVTEKDGKLYVSSPLLRFGKRLVLVIYKKGYIAWRNDYTFPDYVRREKFKWGRNKVFRLEHFTKKHSHSRHLGFIRTALSLNASSKLDRAFSWEVVFANKERDLAGKKRRIKKFGEYTERELWQEVVDELYGEGIEPDDGVIRGKLLTTPIKLKEPGTREINRGPGSGYPVEWGNNRGVGVQEGEIDRE